MISKTYSKIYTVAWLTWALVSGHDNRLMTSGGKLKTNLQGF